MKAWFCGVIVVLMSTSVWAESTNMFAPGAGLGSAMWYANLRSQAAMFNALPEQQAPSYNYNNQNGYYDNTYNYSQDYQYNGYDSTYSNDEYCECEE